MTVPRPELAPARWMGIDQAANLLGMPVLTLRRLVERSARREPDGSVEARVDGVVARKCGRRWRVWLDPDWREPDRFRAGSRR